MSESMVGRIAQYFRASARNEIVAVSAGTSNPRDSFPEILRTGSMLKFGADLLEDAPRRLGPYRILERIGEGGMGVVYLAEQDPPLVRCVAVKLARSAVPGDRALERFESERQTLAVMNHPNIARVFDAGSSVGRFFLWNASLARSDAVRIYSPRHAPRACGNHRRETAPPRLQPTGECARCVRMHRR